ncbi:hypothetical protein AWW66_21370 [Micromonospora rosaria]|uniref:Uncharacterized protein n=1 Tax=Micromonospora rosaria TaxID=47874 RepID=A0A136PNB4_9ACTN|nr:hypothetical protein AWW66_21370 [Micromonospora rosaria]
MILMGRAWLWTSDRTEFPHHRLKEIAMMHEVLELQVVETEDAEFLPEAPITDGSGISFTC